MHPMHEPLKKFVDDLSRRMEESQGRMRDASRTVRTATIHRILHEMAKRRRYKFHPHQRRGRRQWLCDFMWMRWTNSPTRYLKRIGLAAECEWILSNQGKGSHILYDFQKLLPLNAARKLFIYRLPRRAGTGLGEKVRGKILASIRAYRDRGRQEHYFLLEVHRKDGSASIYHLKTDNRGSVPPKGFRLLSARLFD